MVLKHAGVTAGIAVLASSAATLLRPDPAAAAPPTGPGESASEVASGAGGLTNLDGIHAEYQTAVRLFPLDLPPNATFPSTSSLIDADANVLWEPNAGVGEAYLFWNNATAVAANDAHSHGNAEEAARLLDALEAGFSSPIRQDSWDDGGTFAPAMKKARNGDYEALLELSASGVATRA